MAHKKKADPQPQPQAPWRGLEIGFWLGLAWMIFVAWAYGRRFKPLELLPVIQTLIPPGFVNVEALVRHLTGLGIGLGLWAGAWALGAPFLAGRRGLSSLGRWVLSGVLGLGMMAYLVYFLGLAQLYRTWIFWALWIGLVGFAAYQAKTRLWPLLQEAGDELAIVLKASSIWLLIPLLLLAGWAFAMAFVPELFYDSHVYQTGVPRWYLLMGGIKKFFNLHSDYPLTISMLYTFALAINGEIAAKLFHWLCGALVLLGMMAWSNEEKEPRAGVWAALVFLSMPMVTWNWWTTGTDLGVSIFGLAAAWSWSRFWAAAEEERDQTLLILAGIFAGFCFGSKLTGALYLGLLPALHLAWSLAARRPWKAGLRESFLVGGAGLLTALPWMIRAYVFTGNPVFPFLGSLFNSLDAERMGRFYSESEGANPQAWWHWVILPWIVTFMGGNSLSFMGPLALAALPLGALLFVRRLGAPRHVQMLFLLGCLGCAGVAVVNRLTRYWMPYLAALILPLAWTWAQAGRTNKVRRKGLEFVALAMALLDLLIAFQIVPSTYRPWPVLLGKETPEEYQSYTHSGMYPQPATVMYEWARKNLPAGSKLLILGDEKVASCKIPFVAAGVYDIGIPALWARGLSTPQELYEKFRAEGITHILVNLLEGRRLLGYGILDWPEPAVALFCRLWRRHVRLLREDAIPERFYRANPPLFLYNVLSEEEAVKQPPPWNTVLWLYEESKAPSDQPDAWAKKRALYEGLVQRHPETADFAQRLEEIKAIQNQQQQKK